jgi:cyclohexanone monooxygenase
MVRPATRSSAAASAACWPARGCARPASRTSASSRRAATSAAPGTGTAIPGAASATSSYVYLPLLEESATCPRSTPRRRRSSSTAAHRRALRLYDNALFQTEVTDLRVGRRRRALDRQHQPRRRDAARFVVMANGRCTGPSCPASRASRRFKGHSSTPAAGTTTTPAAIPAGPDGPADKRVGIIGTGATAVQCVPHLGAAPSSSTSSSARRRHRRAQQPPTDPDWAASLSPAGSSGAWTTSTSSSPAAARTRTSSTTAGPTSSATCWACAQAKEDRQPGGIERATTRARRLREDGADPRPGRRDRQADPATAEALKPWYRQFCKRPCFHDEYLPTFNRPTSRWSTPTARASSASPRRASSSTASSTSSTA